MDGDETAGWQANRPIRALMGGGAVIALIVAMVMVVYAIRAQDGD